MLPNKLTGLTEPQYIVKHKIIQSMVTERCLSIFGRGNAELKDSLFFLEKKYFKTKKIQIVTLFLRAKIIFLDQFICSFSWND